MGIYVRPNGDPINALADSLSHSCALNLGGRKTAAAGWQNTPRQYLTGRNDFAYVRPPAAQKWDDTRRNLSPETRFSSISPHPYACNTRFGLCLYEFCPLVRNFEPARVG